MAGPRLVLDVIRRDHVRAADGGREGHVGGVERRVGVVVGVRVLQDGGRASGADKGRARGVVGGLEDIGDLIRRGGGQVGPVGHQIAGEVDVADDVEGGDGVGLADGEVAAGGEVDVGSRVGLELAARPTDRHLRTIGSLGHPRVTGRVRAQVPSRRAPSLFDLKAHECPRGRCPALVQCNDLVHDGSVGRVDRDSRPGDREVAVDGDRVVGTATNGDGLDARARAHVDGLGAPVGPKVEGSGRGVRTDAQGGRRLGVHIVHGDIGGDIERQRRVIGPKGAREVDRADDVQGR